MSPIRTATLVTVPADPDGAGEAEDAGAGGGEWMATAGAGPEDPEAAGATGLSWGVAAGGALGLPTVCAPPPQPSASGSIRTTLDLPTAHLPLNCGLRFSANAASASRRSSLERVLE